MSERDYQAKANEWEFKNPGRSYRAEDTAQVTSLTNKAADKTAERAAAKGLPGLVEWMMTGEVQ